MKTSSLRYLTREGFRNVWVNRLMSVASIGVLMACMVLIGLAILLSMNVNKGMHELEQQNVVMVYFNDKNSVLYGDASALSSAPTTVSSTVSTSSAASSTSTSSGATKNAAGIPDSAYLIHNEDEAKALCDKIKKLNNIATVEFVSSDEALARMKETMLEGQDKYFDFINGEGNPMSNGAKVTMKDLTKFETTVQSIKAVPGVTTINSQEAVVEKIRSIRNAIGIAVVSIISILMVIALVIVTNTIRVTMYNRKLEISIMKAVGATDWFIRLPFIIEGMLLGLISALLSEALLYTCYSFVIGKVGTALGTTKVIPFGQTAWMLLGVFAAIGVVAGAIGSSIIIGKYLRKEGSEFRAL